MCVLAGDEGYSKNGSESLHTQFSASSTHVEMKFSNLSHFSLFLHPENLYPPIFRSRRASRDDLWVDVCLLINEKCYHRLVAMLSWPGPLDHIIIVDVVLVRRCVFCEKLSAQENRSAYTSSIHAFDIIFGMASWHRYEKEAPRIENLLDGESNQHRVCWWARLEVESCCSSVSLIIIGRKRHKHRTFDALGRWWNVINKEKIKHWENTIFADEWKGSVVRSHCIFCIIDISIRLFRDGRARRRASTMWKTQNEIFRLPSFSRDVLGFFPRTTKAIKFSYLYINRSDPMGARRNVCCRQSLSVSFLRVFVRIGEIDVSRPEKHTRDEFEN